MRDTPIKYDINTLWVWLKPAGFVSVEKQVLTLGKVYQMALNDGFRNPGFLPYLPYKLVVVEDVNGNKYTITNPNGQNIYTPLE